MKMHFSFEFSFKPQIIILKFFSGAYKVYEPFWKIEK